MEWIQENVGLFVIIIGVILIIIATVLAFVLIKVRVLVKNTVDSSLKMEAVVKNNSNEEDETISITVYNTNFRDVIIHGFGFSYNEQEIDFIEEYMKNKNLADRPAVPARSSITFTLELKRLEKYILGHNYKGKKINHIINVVTDSVGNRILSKNRSLRRWLSKRQKIRLMRAKVMLQAEKVARYQDSHGGKKPISDAFWRFFHPRLTKSKELVERNERLALGEVLADEVSEVEVVVETPKIEKVKKAKKEPKAVEKKAIEEPVEEPVVEEPVVEEPIEVKEEPEGSTEEKENND